MLANLDYTGYTGITEKKLEITGIITGCIGVMLESMPRTLNRKP